jgi:hypothetical protein
MERQFPESPGILEVSGEHGRLPRWCALALPLIDVDAAGSIVPRLEDRAKLTENLRQARRIFRCEPLQVVQGDEGTLLSPCSTATTCAKDRPPLPVTMADTPLCRE